MSLLVNHFNPAAVPKLMCRSLVSVSYEGTLYDCDFNQTLQMPIVGAGQPSTIWSLDDLVNWRMLQSQRAALFWLHRRIRLKLRAVPSLARLRQRWRRDDHGPRNNR